jgi:nitroreductase
MSGEPLNHEEFLRLIEAARWAPSSFNSQPWRFIYAHRNTPSWSRLFDLLVPFNQEWAKNAAVLVVILSKKTFEYDGKPSRTHSFDTGSAWQNLSLQGWAMGLAIRGIGGFDYEKARTELKIPDDYNIETMCAIGKIGKKEDLPKEMQEREFPTDRKPTDELVCQGTCKNSW